MKQNPFEGEHAPLIERRRDNSSFNLAAEDEDGYMPERETTAKTEGTLATLIFFWGRKNLQTNRSSSNSSTTPRGGRRPRSNSISHQTQVFINGMYLLILFYSLLINLGPVYLACRPKELWCPYDPDDETSYENDNRYLQSGDGGASEVESKYGNPDYDVDPCRRFLRLPILCGLTLEECDISRRMLVAVILGGIIGYERRSSDRPAGIRTMGLVSLGACFYTISSIMAFKSSTMGWDSSRVTAALPSGVGFLGGALIWKGTVFVEDGEKHQVHGLTTAASVWLSAAIGVGAGGGLYSTTLYGTVLVLLVLRFGPKMYLQKDSDDGDDQTEEEFQNEEDALAKAEAEAALRASHRKSTSKTVPTFGS